MNSRIFLGIAAIIFGIVATVMAAYSTFAQTAAVRTLKDGWDAWEAGDILQAKAHATKHLEDDHEVDEARHLLFLTSMVMGDYEDALAHYAEINEMYGGLSELDEPMVEVYLYLGEISEALNFARSRKGFPDWMIEALDRHVEQPFTVELSDTTVVPFADHPLTEFFPAFTVEINGETSLAHVDTGGAFLYMGPERAKALGVKTYAGGTGSAHLDSRSVENHIGIVDRLVLGDAVLLNVPVAVMPTLVEGSQGDFVIFGTRILEPFFSTLDYPGQQLILTPRDDDGAKKKHLAMLPPSHVRMPFYLWGDHFMFARGSFGPHHDLNFFVDSGLVAIYPDGEGGARQVGFTTSKRKFMAWGISRKELRADYFLSPHALNLGTLEQEGHFLMPGKAGDTDFGGVRIDGLISHGFLKQYAWTIDFDTREYIFSME